MMHPINTFLITTRKHQNKYFGFDLHCSEVEIFKIHYEEEFMQESYLNIN